MSIAAVQSYIRSLLNGMPWPAGFQQLAVPVCYITPPNPNVQSAIPTLYVWPSRGRESRDTTRLRAGTVPRIAVPGGPSGTKVVEHKMEAWLVWMNSSDDPDADNLVPGMTWAVQDVLRSAAYGANGLLAEDPAELTDPWTGEQSWLVDLGELQTYEIYVRALEDQRFWRYDVAIELDVTEVIAA